MKLEHIAARGAVYCRSSCTHRLRWRLCTCRQHNPCCLYCRPCRQRHSTAQRSARTVSHPCCPCHSWYDPSPGTALTHIRPLARVQVVPDIAHASSSRPCCPYCRSWCRMQLTHSSCTHRLRCRLCTAAVKTGRRTRRHCRYLG